MLREIYKKKVVLLGDWGVGKTSLVRRFVEDSFDEKYIVTIGTNVLRKSVEFDDIPPFSIRMEYIIWDVLGQEGFERVKARAYQGAEGALVVCDLTREESVEHLHTWVDAVRSRSPEVCVILLGNKVDLVEEDAEGISLLNDVSGRLSVKHYLTSARTGVNVEPAFRALGREMYFRMGGRARAGSVPRLNAKVVADVLMDTFCLLHGGYESAMPTVQEAFRRNGVDIREISVDDLRAVLATLEESIPLLEHERETYDSFIEELERQVSAGISLPEGEPVPQALKEKLCIYLKGSVESGEFDLNEAWDFGG